MCLDPIPCAFMKAKTAQEMMMPLVHNCKRYKSCSFLNQTVKGHRTGWKSEKKKSKIFFFSFFSILLLFRCPGSGWKKVNFLLSS